MEFEKLLAKKRRRSMYKLVLPIIGEFLLMAAPTPTVEVPKAAIISAAEMAIFFDIWKLYFDDDLEEGSAVSILEELGLMALVGSGAAFMTAKITDGLVGELGNLVPGAGWILEGLVASMITIIAGVLFINFCEKVYREKFSPA